MGQDNPSHFWQAADQFERANGSTYRELEIALPRELTPEQRLELVQDFVRQEAGERHARVLPFTIRKRALTAANSLMRIS